MSEAVNSRPNGDDPFWVGVEAGQFPRRGVASGAVDAAVTTGKSHWLGTRCTTCYHTFRPGDEVRLGADGSVSHTDPALRCACQPESDDSATSAGDRFVEGLLEAWPPVNDVPVFLLTANDWQVTQPRTGPTSLTCPGCGHTFRAGDTVIICPCAGGEVDQRREYCQVTVHRDPARGLCCWDEWAPDGRLGRCPRTLLRTTK